MIDKSCKFDKSFLEDEIRLGFYIPAAIKQAWAAELEVLKVVDDICSKLDIKYFAEWGTLLGAVRHRGFIPWDDDMDIMMLREDYDRFYAEAPKLFPDGYSIHTFRNEEGFKEFHAVVVNAEHINFDKEQFDRFHGFNYLCGIDIFIMDYLYPNEKDEDKRIKEAIMIIALADSILDHDMSDSELSALISRAETLCNEDLKHIKDKKQLWIRLYELADLKCAEVSKDKSDTLTQMVPWGLKKRYPYRFRKSDFENIIRLPFENTTVPVPLLYNYSLSKHYEDYLNVRKDGGAHEYPFFESQKNSLEKLLGFSISEYSFNPDNLLKNINNSDSFKPLLRDGLNELSSLNSRISEYAVDETDESFSECIFAAQDLAINIGNIIEEIYTQNHPCIQLISDYCENLYLLYNHSLEDNSSINSSFNEMSKEILKEILGKKIAVFLPFKADHWDSFSEVFNSLKERDDFEIFVVPIPYYYKEFDGSLSDEQYDLSLYPKNINAVSYSSFPLEFIHPDYIFIHNPYDQFNAATSIHPDFYSSIIKNYTDKLIYTPWFKTCEIGDKDYRSYKNMKYYVTVPGIINSDITLVRSEQEKLMYIKKLSEWAKEEYLDKIADKIQLWNADSFNALNLPYSKPVQNNISNVKNILYYLGTAQALENPDFFIKKIQNTVATIAEEKEKTNITLVIDCLLEESLSKNAPDILSEFKIAISDISKSDTVTILYDNDSTVDLSSCDAYYGDASFLACEYILAHKPVMIQNFQIFS